MNINNYPGGKCGNGVYQKYINLDYVAGYEDHINWTDVFVEIETPSKIENYGAFNITNYILMQVQYKNNSVWQTISTIYNQSLLVKSGNTTDLSTIWNPIAWNSANNLLGTYRIYTALTDSSGNVAQNQDNSYANDTYEFILDFLRIVVQSPQNGAIVDATHFWANLTLNYTSYPSGGWCAYYLDDNFGITASSGNLTGSGYTDEGGTYVNTTSDDGSYWFFGDDTGEIIGLIIDAYAELTFDLSAYNILESHVGNLSFSLNYCHSGEIAPNVGCNGDGPSGSSLGSQDVQVYNYSSNSWVNIGVLSTTDGGDEVSGNWYANGTMVDYINDTSYEVKVRYRFYYVNMDRDSSFLVMSQFHKELTGQGDRESRIV